MGLILPLNEIVNDPNITIGVDVSLTKKSFGIAETEDVVRFAGKSWSKVAAMDDGSVWDIGGAIMGSSISAYKAFDGVKMVPQEIMDLDESEVETLKAAFMDELELENEYAELAAEKAFESVLNGLNAFALYQLSRQVAVVK